MNDPYDPPVPLRVYLFSILIALGVLGLTWGPVLLVGWFVWRLVEVTP